MPLSKPIVLDETGQAIVSAINEQTEHVTAAINEVNPKTYLTKQEAKETYLGKNEMANSALKDNNNKVISETYVDKNDVGNAADKIPRYNSEGHLVLPSGVELW